MYPASYLVTLYLRLCSAAPRCGAPSTLIGLRMKILSRGKIEMLNIFTENISF